jgi:RNA recognition motif-containing protein
MYVQGLPLTMTETDIQSYFSPYGQIINVRILRQGGESGPSKGVGFVRFDKVSLHPCFSSS